MAVNGKVEIRPVCWTLFWGGFFTCPEFLLMDAVDDVHCSDLRPPYLGWSRGGYFPRQGMTQNISSGLSLLNFFVDQGIHRRSSSHASWLSISAHDTVAQLSSRSLTFATGFSLRFFLFLCRLSVCSCKIYSSHFECSLHASVGRGPFSALVALLPDYYI